MNGIRPLSAAFAALVLGLAAWPRAAAQTPPQLTYIPASTVKINQIVGETDKQFHRPTLSRTETRYGLKGVDLGYSFENDGKAFFLFGDTLGVEGHAWDSMATSDAADPSGGVKLDFLSPGPGHYMTVRPPGISMGPFEVPVSGIELDGKTYVVVLTGHNATRTADRSVLTRASSPITSTGFQPLRTIAAQPSGKFIKMSLHLQPAAIPGLPAGGPYVLMWGTGRYRHSDAYLAIVPAASFESGNGTQYFRGLDAGQPLWSSSADDAAPLTSNGTLGDLSVTWSKDLRLWLMTYDSREPASRGILFSYSTTPWGPWSRPQVIFEAHRDGAMGKFIHQQNSDDGLSGPVIGKNIADPNAVNGAQYGPYVVERWTKLKGSELDLFWVLSTWNPYVVNIMESRLRIGS